MDQTHHKKHLTQQLSTAVELNHQSIPILKEKDILELIYQDKWDAVKSCITDQKDYIEKYNKNVSENKDEFGQIHTAENDDDVCGFDQQNRMNWFMPKEYKNFDIESYILNLAKTDQEQERVRYELDLFKTYAMLDVLVFLKYLIDTLRAKNIVWGVGRGSSVASYVLYLLGVHKVDSLKYDLDPKEFLR